MLDASGEFKDVAMREEALAMLCGNYPTRLSRWDALGTSRASSSIFAEPAMDVDVLAAFQRWGIYTGLPAAFFKVCKHYTVVSWVELWTKQWLTRA